MSKHLKFEERLITFIKFEQMLIIFATIIHKIFETNSCMFPCKTAHYGENWFSVFQQIYSSTDKIFISGGGLSTRQQFYDVLIFFCKFVRQLLYTTLLLIISLRFTCGERKISSIIKKSQNIMNMIACKIFFCILWFY